MTGEIIDDDLQVSIDDLFEEDTNGYDQRFKAQLEREKEIITIVDPKFPQLLHVLKNNKFYPELELVGISRVPCDDGQGYTIVSDIDISQISPERRRMLFLSLRYHQMNPHHPINGTLCANLENYLPSNDSQRGALFYAKSFVTIETDHDCWNPAIPAGIMYYGDPGTGKTHLVVGIGIEYMARGWNVNFVSPDNGPKKEIVELVRDSFWNDGTQILCWQEKVVEPRPKQVWIFDNVNPAKMDAVKDLFLKVVAYVSENGGRILVTSAKEDYGGWFGQMFGSDGHTELTRWRSIVEGFIKPYRITGESYRVREAWYAGLSANTAIGKT